MSVLTFQPMDAQARRVDPAVERMERAKEWLAIARAKGYIPQVSWDPHCHIVSMGRVGIHPIGLLPELVFLLRHQAPAPGSSRGTGQGAA